MWKQLITSMSLSALVLVGGARLAAAAPGRGRPPQAAFDACNGKSEGTACTVSHGDHQMAGVCAATPEGTLACRPDHPPGPPPEVTAACGGKADGDACTVTFGDHSEEGVCRKGRSGGLICLF